MINETNEVLNFFAFKMQIPTIKIPHKVKKLVEFGPILKILANGIIPIRSEKTSLGLKNTAAIAKRTKAASEKIPLHITLIAQRTSILAHIMYSFQLFFIVSIIL